MRSHEYDRLGRRHLLTFRIAQYVAFAWWGSRVSVKNPRYEPSLHWRSVFAPTRTVEILSAFTGAIPAPNEDVEVTAVPANSTPIAPSPVSGL